MVDWARFIPLDFEYDFTLDKLEAHKVTFEEAGLSGIARIITGWEI